jgi:hypothetical protein
MKPKILSDEQIHRSKYGYSDVNPACYLTKGDKDIAQAQLDADVAYYEPLIQQAKAEVARIWDDVVCPMCYRLNPHHAHENRGEGCNWCSEKEDYTGQTLEQSLKSKWGKE